MQFYKVIYKTRTRRQCKIVRSGELDSLIRRCHEHKYNILNIEHA